MTSSFTVFVCSTFSDLSEEREGVLDAIRRLALRHDSMEFFGARAEQPIEVCLQEVRLSDVLVVIVGHRYGSIVPALGISYSEAEYTEGIRLNKPCLVYMRDENVPILPKHMERDAEKLKLLERWKETLHARHTVCTFRDSSRLAVQVAADLARTKRELEERNEATAASRLAPSPLDRLEYDYSRLHASQNIVYEGRLREIPGYDLAVGYRPLSMITADFVDVFAVNEDTFGIAIGDVAGIGASGTLVAVMAVAVIHTAMKAGMTLDRCVRHLNRFLLARSGPTTFSTCFIGLLNAGQHTLSYISAGHDPGRLLRESGAGDLLESTGIPVGMFDEAEFNAAWDTREVSLDRGDCLLLLTDGITEVQNKKGDGEDFGSERTGGIVRSSLGKPAGDVLAALLAAVDSYGEQGDDQTVVVLRRL